ncbi:phosphotransferase enzyme family protein [Rhodotorula toruloides]|uniref:Phosphotransferase enzyme family protein n=1 Tax=Rhodotorula toruloides TaxID=5286 RepID=A0A511KRL4_RHOTO|nr:phosphotransferase enzyme family protein [Rhodotorula toruloides]
MRLVGRQTRIPVPKLLGVAEDSGETFIYQDYIKGATLADTWKTLSSAELDGVKSDFDFILSELASLSAPPGIRLGACDTKVLSQLGGPCHAVLAQKPESALYNVDEFQEGGVGLVHANLRGGHIMGKDGRIAAIIDWGLAAWLPRAVEPVALIVHPQRDFSSRAPALEALLESFNLEEATLEGFRILSEVFFADTDIPTTDDDDW